jgi:cell division protein FtsB
LKGFGLLSGKGIAAIVNQLHQFVEGLLRRRRWITTTAFGMVAMLVLNYALFSPNGWMSYRQKKVEYQHLQQEMQRLNDENQRLDQEIQALKTDPKAIEREAREQFRFAKPGEVIYVVPQHDAPQPPQPTQNARK